MRRPPSAPSRRSIVVQLICTLALVAVAPVAEAQVMVGPNVNMGGGPAIFTPPSTIIGDPFLQRQNEPSIAVSSRNPCHLLAGANDYRAVDVEDAAGEIGDAWLGVFKSFDCGATWTSTLMPGHKLDTSPQGLAAPIKGLAAAADPTVRAGTSGLFYYSGIAFNRGDGEVGKVFVARFIDNNNKDGGDPIEYAGMRTIDVGTSGQFLDKPWVIADIPRSGIMCTVNGRSVPAGPVYLVYTTFLGSGNNVHTNILFSKSTDCGATWSNPAKLSERVARNQGTTIAVDPGTGHIHVAWREFANAADSTSRNAILYARSQDGGKSFTKAAAINPAGFSPFDQVSSVLSFRTNAYPTIAVVPAEADGRTAGQPGRVYVAWSARGFAPARPNDGRVVMSNAIGGNSWTAPRIADAFADAGHQIMPAVAFAGGKVALAYYDLRDDVSDGFEDLVFEYGLRAYQDCKAQSEAQFGNTVAFSVIFSCMLTHPDGLSRRHTLDMRAAMADAACLAAGTCTLESTSVLGVSSKVSRYPEGRGQVNGPRVQLQYNRPNLPIFSKGQFPFIGDYIDIAGQNFVVNANGTWSSNSGQTANRPAPVFHVAWADNRNVGTPRDTVWANFTPAVLGPGMVICSPGQTGIRNQDVYTSQLRPGLVVSAPQNSKRIAGLQRSFVVIAQNTTDAEHNYVLRATPPAGVIASFSQFSGFGALDGSGNPTTPLTEIVVRIPRKSSASRTVFVGLVNPPADPSQAPDVLVPVAVEQLPDAAAGAAFDAVFLNPDFENPDFENPDFENTELHNPDFENPDFENPDFENPDFENFTLSASNSIRNPDFENPDFENPDFENPDFENPDFENPDFENPDFENPDFENPDFENPDFENPDFENPDFENGSFQVADTTWPVRNNGNTTSAYKTNVFVNNPPAGVRYQLAVRRVFTSPAAVCAAPGSTEAPRTAQSVALINIVDPNVQTNPFNRDFNDPSRENATFSLAPGERGYITLRAYCEEGNASCTRDLLASLQNTIALGVVAQGANCATCTGAACTLGDFVKGPTECSLETGPPKDIYDPIAPVVTVLNPTLTSPETVFVASDSDNSGAEPVTFTLNVTDNVAVANVTCASGATAVSLLTHNGGDWSFAGNFPVGTNGVTCAATDVRAEPAPNQSVVAFLVRVKDVTPPTFDLGGGTPGAPFVPSNPAQATSPAGAVVQYTNPTASDTNGGPVGVVCKSGGGLLSGSTFPIGSTGIDCIATDQSGVSTPPTNLFAVNVVDSVGPTLTLNGASPMTVEAGTAFVDPGVTAVDTVSGVLTATRTGTVNTAVAGTYTLTYSATDAAGNTRTISRTVIVADTVAPVLTAVAQPPTLLWSPNKTMTPVTVSGVVTDATTVSISFKVVDEYGKIQPTGPVTVGAGGNYAFTIKLEAYRNGTDYNGRLYTITVTATDAGGRTKTASTTVLVPHNQ